MVCHEVRVMRKRVLWFPQDHHWARCTMCLCALLLFDSGWGWDGVYYRRGVVNFTCDLHPNSGDILLPLLLSRRGDSVNNAWTLFFSFKTRLEAAPRRRRSGGRKVIKCPWRASAGCRLCRSSAKGVGSAWVAPEYTRCGGSGCGRGTVSQYPEI